MNLVLTFQLHKIPLFFYLLTYGTPSHIQIPGTMDDASPCDLSNSLFLLLLLLLLLRLGDQVSRIIAERRHKQTVKLPWQLGIVWKKNHLYRLCLDRDEQMDISVSKNDTFKNQSWFFLPNFVHRNNTKHKHLWQELSSVTRVLDGTQNTLLKWNQKRLFVISNHNHVKCLLPIGNVSFFSRARMQPVGRKQHYLCVGIFHSILVSIDLTFWFVLCTLPHFFQEDFHFRWYWNIVVFISAQVYHGCCRSHLKTWLFPHNLALNTLCRTWRSRWLLQQRMSDMTLIDCEIPPVIFIILCDTVRAVMAVNFTGLRRSVIDAFRASKDEAEWH